ncbi:hypothetical protein Dimus_038253 [Dionaea muscipula]
MTPNNSVTVITHCSTTTSSSFEFLLQLLSHTQFFHNGLLLQLPSLLHTLGCFNCFDPSQSQPLHRFYSSMTPNCFPECQSFVHFHFTEFDPWQPQLLHQSTRVVFLIFKSESHCSDS